MKMRYREGSLHDMLCSFVKDGSLTEQSNAPVWVHELADTFRTDLGLLALHGISGLSEQLPERPLVRVPLCAADNLILLLTHNAVQTRQHLAIAIPPGTVMIPMLMVCKTLLADLLEGQDALDDPTRVGVKERGGVLLVSPDSEMRARYFSMRVGQESVYMTYPACRMRPDGSVAPVLDKYAKATDKPSVCFFLAHQKELPDPQSLGFMPAVTLLDLTHDRWLDRLSEVVEWCLQLRDARAGPTTLITILPFGDRATREAMDRHSIAVFPLDSTGILDLVDGFEPITPPDTDPARDAYSTWSYSAYALDKPLERQHTVYRVPDDAAAAALRAARDVYQTLDAIGERRSHRDLHLARWLVNILMQLPIPVQWYEQQAYEMGNRQTLRSLISGLGNRPGNALSQDLTPVLQSLRGQLDYLYTCLSNDNPKSRAFWEYFTRELQPHLHEGASCAVIVRNEVVARAVAPWLLNQDLPSDQLTALRILPYKSITGREMFAHMVSTAWWPSRYRWQIGGRLGRQMDFLLYQGEESVLEQQMQPFYSARYRSYFARRRSTTLHAFGDIQDIAEPLPLPRDAPGALVAMHGVEPSPEHADGPMFDEPTDEIDPDVKSLFDFAMFDPAILPPIASGTLETGTEGDEAAVVQWQDVSTDVVAEEIDTVMGDEQVPEGSPTEPCILLTIRLAGAETADSVSRYLYLPLDEATDCYVPGQAEDEIQRVENGKIEPEYILVRTNEGGRQNLFDRAAELADAQPTMKYLRVWRGHWLNAVQSLMHTEDAGIVKKRTYRQVQNLLTGAGAPVTTLTIRDWVSGERIGPGSVTSIKAVGYLSKHHMLQEYPDKIDAAFRQIRTIHQILGRRISDRLQSISKAQASNTPARGAKREIKLDPALSVPLDDLLDLLQFWRVVDVHIDPFAVPISRVGVVRTTAPYAPVTNDAATAPVV